MRTDDDGYWLWFFSDVRPDYEITGKYLFFSENAEVLKQIAHEEITNNGFHKAKINKHLIGQNTEYVLCLYYKDDSRKYELARKYQGKNDVKYRYWKSDEDTRKGKYSMEFLEKIKPSAHKPNVRVITFGENGSTIEIELNDDVKPLRLSYELAWRTKKDEEFMKSKEWKETRRKVLERDGYTCRYCGQTDLKMQVNHIDGNPKNNELDNLETVCAECHMIMHSGLWCAVHGIIDCYTKSKYSQNEIIQITRALRKAGVPDDKIIKFLNLKKPAPWKQNLKYLSKLYGFITSTKPLNEHKKPHLTEKQQRESLGRRDSW